MKVLFVDIGNSRSKFAYLDGQKVIRVAADAVMALPDDSLQEIWLADVSQTQPPLIAAVLAAHPSARVHIISTVEQRIGFSHIYRAPEKLGVDRFLAMLAVNGHSAALVIDAGTALTLDAVANNQHLGGYIVPGFNLSRQALLAKNQALSAFSTPTQTQWGDSTESCINQGLLLSHLALIEASWSQLLKKDKNARLILAGGDGYLLHQQLIQRGIKNTFLPDLVFAGIRIYRQSLIK